MKRTKIKELWTNAAAFDGAHITVCGWARTIRDMKNFGFLELNDGSSFKGVQVVLEREKVANYDEIVRQNVGAAFIAEGTLVLTPDAPQPFELKAADRHGRGRFLAGLPAAEKAPQRGVSAHDPASPPAHESVLRGVPRARRCRRTPSMSSSRSRGFVYVQHPHHHRL